MLAGEKLKLISSGVGRALMLRSRAYNPRTRILNALWRGVSKREGTPSPPFETRARTFDPCGTAAARALLRVRTP